MSQKNFFAKHKYSIVFFTTVIVAMLATIFLMTQVILPSVLPARTVPILPPPTSQPSTIMPQSASETPSLPQPTATTSSALAEPTEMPSLGWQPLPALSQENYILITNGNRLDNKIALTFDACQTYDAPSGYDTEIVRILTETQTPATFFLGGLWMQDHPEATLELARNPLFELGNHSWSHPDFSVLSESEIAEEIQLTQQKMYELVGFQTNLFRLPFGTYTDASLDAIADNGLYTIQWDVESGDPDPNVDAQAMIGWVTYQAESGSIIIMHVNGRGWHTAEALPAIIESLNAQGYEFVTVSELLGLNNE